MFLNMDWQGGFWATHPRRERTMAKKVVAVLGGTGLQGGGVVDALTRAGKFSVRVISRNPYRRRCPGAGGARSRGGQSRSTGPEQPPFWARGGAWSVRGD